MKNKYEEIKRLKESMNIRNKRPAGMTRKELINDYEKMAKRFELEGKTDQFYYKDVLKKIEYLKLGADYKIKSYQKEMIETVGSCIPATNKGFNSKIPMRGKPTKNKLTELIKETIKVNNF